MPRLSEAILRINESLEMETMPSEVIDGACKLAGARYGGITLLDQPVQF